MGDIVARSQAAKTKRITYLGLVMGGSYSGDEVELGITLRLRLSRSESSLLSHGVAMIYTGKLKWYRITMEANSRVRSVAHKGSVVEYFYVQAIDAEDAAQRFRLIEIPS